MTTPVPCNACGALPERHRLLHGNHQATLDHPANGCAARAVSIPDLFENVDPWDDLAAVWNSIFVPRAVAS